MFDSIGEHVCFTLTVLPSVLLRSKHNSLSSLHSVNPIYNLIKPLHLLELLGIYIEEVLLNSRISPHPHHNHASLFILVALTVYLP